MRTADLDSVVSELHGYADLIQEAVGCYNESGNTNPKMAGEDYESKMIEVRSSLDNIESSKIDTFSAVSLIVVCTIKIPFLSTCLCLA